MRPFAFFLHLARACVAIASLSAAAADPPAYPVDGEGRANYQAVCLPCRGFAQDLRMNEDLLAAMKAEFGLASAVAGALKAAALRGPLTARQDLQMKKDAKIAEMLAERIPLQEANVTRARNTLNACLKEKCGAQAPRGGIEVTGGGGAPPPPRTAQEEYDELSMSGEFEGCDCASLLAQAKELQAKSDEYTALERAQEKRASAMQDEIDALLQSLQEIDPALTAEKALASPYFASLVAQKAASEKAAEDFKDDASGLHMLSVMTMIRYEKCIKACTPPPEPQVQVAINVNGNNPLKPTAPMEGRTPTGVIPQPPANAFGTLQLNPTTIVTVTEGDSVTFTIRRVGGKSGNVGVRYETFGEGATPGQDFTPAIGNFTWAEGDDSPRSVTIPIVEDNVREDPEAFSFAISNATGGATIADPAFVRVIIRDRGAPEPAGTVQLSASAYSTAEGQGAVTITATRAGGSNGAIAVQYRTDSGSAVASSDFSPVNGTFTWASGNTSNQTFTVAITDDALVETPETFTVVLSGATLNGAASAAVLGAPASAIVTITDNDVSTPVGPCGPQGNAWQPNTGASYNCSGICTGMAASQTVTVQGDVVTVTPFDEGPPAAVQFPGCGATVSSTRGDLSFFAGQRRHRGTLTRTSNNAYSITVVTTSGPSGQCTAACSRSGP